MTRFFKHMRNLAATVPDRRPGPDDCRQQRADTPPTPTRPSTSASGPIAINAQAVNIALALSVEFPTVGAAYRTPDYNHATIYLGYFDATGCYATTIGAGAPLGGEYFYRTGNVDASGYCDNAGSGAGKYSGNLLNYVTASSIDLLRYALTGGNRVVDTAGHHDSRTRLPARRLEPAQQQLPGQAHSGRTGWQGHANHDQAHRRSGHRRRHCRRLLGPRVFRHVFGVGRLRQRGEPRLRAT